MGQYSEMIVRSEGRIDDRREAGAQPESGIAGILGASLGRVAGLDGMRGIAILLVFLVHWSLGASSGLPEGASRSGAAAIFAAGNTGVDLFFALSGFLIYDHLLARPIPWTTFLWRRAWRIYPTYVPVFALYLLLSLMQPEFAKLPSGSADATWYLVRCVLFLPGIVQETPLVGVAWSLSYEIAFYLVLPVFIALFQLRERSAGQRCLAIVALALVILLSASISGLHERLVLFPAGMLARELAVSRPRLVASKAYLWIAAAAFAASFVLIAVARVGWPFLNPDIATAMTCSLVCFVGFSAALPAAIQERGPLARLARGRWLRWMGEISYSYYLMHNLTLKAIFLAIGKVWPHEMQPYTWFFLTPFVFLVTLVPGLILFKLVERPSLSRRPLRRIETAGPDDIGDERGAGPPAQGRYACLHARAGGRGPVNRSAS